MLMLLLYFSKLINMFLVTAATTPPPVTVVYSGVLTTTATVMMTPTSIKLVAALGLHYVLPPQLILRDKITGVVGLPLCHSCNLSWDAFSGLCQLCHGSTSGKFFIFRVELSTDFLMLVHVMC